ncbi:DUF5640 domain-containing protein [Actinocorallia sp. API 0066]|uniref:DUF5640 domain-containing protein n=1 Tax=Actinocorallia sp. API 0066 TaxID=2896846 RepID=UPI001E2E04FA|nr:DUF5640 domain-containing protein [Actinocorallia sp. API 0066]MCD0448168.1 DUF5640 domain-containing protein [Actinocorallia sp. API 0066]
MTRTVIGGRWTRAALVAGAAALLLTACGGEDPAPKTRATAVPPELVGPWQVAEGEGTWQFDAHGSWTFSVPGCRAEGGFTISGTKLEIISSTQPACAPGVPEYAWSVADSTLTLIRPDGQQEVFVRPPSET